MIDAASLALQRLRVMALVVTMGAGLVILVGILAGAREGLQDFQHGMADTLAVAVIRNLDDARSDQQDMQALVQRITQTSDVAKKSWKLVLQDGAGTPLAQLAAEPTPTGSTVTVTRQVTTGPFAGVVVVASLADDTDHYLAMMSGSLLAGLLIGLLLGLEVLVYLATRRLVGPARELTALAAAGIAGDFRRIPASGGIGEIGALRKALASLILFLTLRRREVELLLEDARQDTFDPELVKSAEMQLLHLSGLARVASEEPLPLTLDGDPALQRLLSASMAFLLSLHMISIGDVWLLVLSIAALLVGWHLSAWGPRLLGRRLAILLFGVLGVVATWFLPEVEALAAAAASLAAVLRSATGTADQPGGAVGVDRDVSALAGAAVGAAGAGGLLGATGAAQIGTVFLVFGVVLIVSLAFFACKERLEGPGDSMPTRSGALREVFAVGWVSVILAGRIATSGAAIGLALLVAFQPGHDGWSLLLLGLGLWAAIPLAQRLERNATLTVTAQIASALGIWLALDPMRLPPAAAAGIAGLSATTLWHLSSAAVHSTARDLRGVAAEQAILRSAFLLRTIAVMVTMAASLVYGVEQVATFAMFAAAIAALAIALLRSTRMLRAI